ncbi:NAD(P)/FAD-dependent oxidoreductase [Actinomycetospora sp. TBRC 11914]|nr:NAD(P)/FAD-dependent oxidoreductase [Actinomycetospora sp. TBRC 11914]
MPDEALEAAVAAGNIPTLLLVLAHLTGDDGWLGEGYRPTRTVALHDNDSGGLSERVQAEIRTATVESLRAVRDGRLPVPAPPDDDHLVAMLSFSLGETIPDEYGPSMAEEAGFRTPPQIAWADGRPVSADHHEVLIVGAGASGLATAIGLRDLGVAVSVVERSDGVGGVWQENTYPGAGVDTPAHLYSLSFAPNRSWSRYYAKQPEVRAYLEDMSAEHGLDEVIAFGTEVTRARWDDAAQRWAVTLRDADGERTVTPSVVVSCVGNLNQAAIPDLPGRDEFAGPSFHSSRWPAGLDVTGQRVTVIGTGATAMQIVPAVADDAAEVTVFQRTPQWVVPNPNYLRTVPDGVRLLMERTPYYASFYRLRLVWQFQDKLLATLRRDPDWPHPERAVSAANDKHRAFITAAIEERLGDDAERLRDRVIPSYPPYFKRILMDNEWFDTIRRDDVDLVTEPVVAVDPDAVVTSSGARHETDVVVYATGFHSHRLLYPMDIVGRRGESLRDRWGDDDADAHLGISVPGFPNFFVLGGPHTTLAHGGSAIFASECARAHVLGLLTTMIEQDVASIEVRDEVAECYAARVDAEHEQLIWTHEGAGTWYRNEKGRVVNAMPWRSVDYWAMTRDHGLDAFHVRRRPVTGRGPS